MTSLVRPLVATNEETTELVAEYAKCCRSLQVAPYPSVLTFLRLHLNDLRPEPSPRRTVVFGDADMFAFCEFVLRSKAPCAVFEHWTSIDASRCAITVTGVQILMRVLQQPGCRVHAVNLGGQNIGPRGACALVDTLRATQLQLLNKRLREQQAAAQAAMVAGREAAQRRTRDKRRAKRDKLLHGGGGGDKHDRRRASP